MKGTTEWEWMEDVWYSSSPSYRLWYDLGPMQILWTV